MDPLVLGIIAVLVAGIAALIVPLDRIAFAAVCVFMLAVTWNGFRLGGGVAAGGAGALNNAFLAVAMVAAAGYVVVARPAIRVWPWMLVASGFFLLAAMLTLVFPPDAHWKNETLLSYRTDFTPPHEGILIHRSDLLTLAQWLVAMVVIPSVLVLVAGTVSRVRLLIDIFAVSTIVNAGAGILGMVGIDVAGNASATSRELGLTLHPNYLSLTCTIGIPLAMHWITRGGRWRSAGVIGTLILLGGAYASGGRAGAVTAPLALLATVAVLPKLRRGLPYVLPVVGVLVVSLLAFTSTGDQVLEQLRFSDNESAAGSNSAREELAALGMSQFFHRPLHGVGFGVIQDAHNIYIQLLAAGGILTVIGFGIYIWGLGVATLRVREGPESALGTAAALSIVMWLINGVVNSQLADKYLYIVPGLLVALAYATARAREPAPEPVPAGAPTPAAAVHRPASVPGLVAQR